MKNFLITVFLSFFFTASSLACEICGCGTGSYYIGLLPQFNHHFFGLRYHYSTYESAMKDEPSEFSNDRFQTIEVWGGWNIGKRWQVMAIVPYNIIHQTSDEGVVNRNGLGDIMLMGNYKLWQYEKVTQSNKLIKQQLWLGAGIKFATGKFSFSPDDEALISVANTQTGTASTDFLLNAMYDINIGNFGINTSARYRINTANHEQYMFGNRFSAGSLAYYSFGKKTIVTPNAGVLYEHNEASKLQNEKIALSGGHIVSSAMGVEININTVTIGGNVQIPLSQHFAEDQTKNKVKGMVHVTFSF